jgi:hypothetical protein
MEEDEEARAGRGWRTDGRKGNRIEKVIHGEEEKLKRQEKKIA